MIESLLKDIQYDAHVPARIIIGDKPLPDVIYRMHWHKEIELIYLLDGYLAFEKTGRTIALESGGIILINSGEPHRAVCDENNRFGRFMVLHLSYEYAKKYEPNIDSMFFRLNQNAEARLKKQLDELIRLTENRNGDEYVIFEKKACIMKVYHELFTSCRMEKQVRFYRDKNGSYGKIRTVIEYLGEHYREDITRDEMAALVGLSPVYFSQHFKAVTETTFIHYLSSLRMEHALSDMMSMDISVMEAALRNGFANVKAFSAACKRVYGTTPMKLKKSRLSDDI